MQTRCHVLGVGDTRCRDKELRQWIACVTLSASPLRVTHAYCLLAQVTSARIAAVDNRWMRLPPRVGRHGRIRASAPEDVQRPQPLRAARLYLVFSRLGCLQRRLGTTMPSSSGEKRLQHRLYGTCAEDACGGERFTGTADTCRYLALRQSEVIRDKSRGLARRLSKDRTFRPRAFFTILKRLRRRGCRGHMQFASRDCTGEILTSTEFPRTLGNA